MKNLVINLANELATALELGYDGVELRELWADALDGLRETRQLLVEQDLPVPEAILNVLTSAESDQSVPPVL